ncbi:hypothetical protein LINPERPRIM_LOCUS31495 [Linum perenne]
MKRVVKKNKMFSRVSGCREGLRKQGGKNQPSCKAAHGGVAQAELATDNPVEGDVGVVVSGCRQNKCKSCGFHGHNSRTCPKRVGVQPVSMSVQNRRTVEREFNIANTGFGVAYFPGTDNTYFTNGNASTSGGQGSDGSRRRAEGQIMPLDNYAAIIDLTSVPGSQPRSP